MENHKKEFDLYKDIQTRTGGEIYLGVVGPCRTGKSTFIKRFMDLMVLPMMEDENAKERTIDELPQSAAGKTIMTTEPKFIPKEAATITLDKDVEAKVRLIDCVGFMVDGATGHMEEGAERLVKTPWFTEEIPFTKAAEIGTQKVIADHSTIGIVVTTDGSFGEIPRDNFVFPEERTVRELKKIGKPFVVILNSKKPYSVETTDLSKELEEKYGVSVLPLNCEQLKKDDIYKILESVLYEFPVFKMEFYMPKWVEMLESDHRIKTDIIETARKLLQEYSFMKEVVSKAPETDSDYIEKLTIDKVGLSTGTVTFKMQINDSYYYENMSEVTGVPIHGEYELISLVKNLSEMKAQYDKVADALNAVYQKGYGVVVPEMDDIEIDEPEIMKHGNKYGIKIKAHSPSVHMIRANIETEIAPIIGTEEQAKDLINYMQESKDGTDGIRSTNIFGKTVGELVEDGIHNKISMMSDESQYKLQETMQKIVNDSNGGMVCIII